VAPLPRLAELAMSVIRPGGMVLAIKGINAAEKLRDAGPVLRRLNLTEADQCFLLDPWWNPAVEAQAIDRIHRLGQKRDVKVYRLVARDTVEDKVLGLQARKAQLFASVMKTDGRAFRGAIGAEDLLEIFT
jgi:hypothetical protein